MIEPPYLVEAGGFDFLGDELEDATGADCAELAIVAGHDDLGADCCGSGPDGAKVGGGHHRGLVHHDQLTRHELVLAILRQRPARFEALLSAEPAGDVGRVGKAFLGEDLAGPLRGREPQSGRACRFGPYVGEARHRECLARTGGG